MSKQGTAIVWFRRDLRLCDNPALCEAVNNCKSVIPVYIHAPEEEAPWLPGQASNWWLHKSLSALSDSLQHAGSELIIAKGPSLTRLQEIASKTGATHLYWNRLYDPMTQARDSEIKQGMGEQGLHCHSFSSQLLIEPTTLKNKQGTPYKVFTAFWKVARQRLQEMTPPLPPINKLSAPKIPFPSLPLSSLELLSKSAWYNKFETFWQPGERGAHKQWEQFLYNSLPYYDEQRNFPAEEHTTRLSPHLHFGEITPKQLFWTLQHENDQSPGLSQSLDRLSAQLGWREFAHYTLFHFPHTATESMDSRFTKDHWNNSPDSREQLERWQRGETGIPIVDAGMKQLWQTGWMHNRVRMIVASLLTKNLGIHWLEGARWFWDTLVDADLANNTLGWQWTAGCGVDAAPYFRVFNPARQAERFDPAGRYIKTWLPEFSSADSHELINGRQPANNRLSYPLPMLDLQKTRKQTLERWQRIKTMPKPPAPH
ncbi:cryptochrome/photolyase family protein [Sedimenticola selenatireducens]|uniref:cryptochrome/photolyase family protein n=1 Tax=Sedimenticola selenatireducens TaxID=191960 RepID=UPI0021B25331|nr:deoxyribodipyrimidine photo-lyase [Sedimenticola selenatireducens]